jgi:hypothetical protein
MNAATIYCHRVEIYTGKKRTYEKDIFRVTTAQVLAENNAYMVLDDFHFTKLEKARDKDWNAYSVFELPAIDVHVDSKIWSDGVVFSLYASHEWPAENIQTAIKRAIEKKRGWLNGRVSFAVLKKKEAGEDSAAS